MQNRPPLTPELEAAIEDIWAYFAARDDKAPSSIELILRELRTLCETRVTAAAMQRWQIAGRPRSIGAAE